MEKNNNSNKRGGSHNVLPVININDRANATFNFYIGDASTSIHPQSAQTNSLAGQVQPRNSKKVTPKSSGINIPNPHLVSHTNTPQTGYNMERDSNTSDQGTGQRNQERGNVPSPNALTEQFPVRRSAFTRSPPPTNVVAPFDSDRIYSFFSSK